MKRKKVEMAELFYDLVYAFAISCTTSLLEAPEGGVISMGVFLVYIVATIGFINSWMVQTLYTNRYGENSLKDVLFSILQMPFVIIGAVSMSSDIAAMQMPVLLSLSALSCILLVQYVIEYHNAYYRE
jgi:low temperature requirement protein LtrA